MRRSLRLAPLVPLLLAAALAGCAAAPEEAAEGDVPLGTGGYEQVVFDGRLYQCEDTGHADTLCRLFVPAEGEATVEDAPEADVRPDGTALLNGRVYVCGDAEERAHVVSETNESALEGEVSPGGTSGECPAWRLSA